MVQDREDGSFHQLRFHDRCYDFDQRFAGENNRSFWNGINVAAEMEVFQIFQKIFIENMKVTEIIDICFGKTKIFDVIDDLFKTCSDGLAAVTGIFPVKSIEDDFFFVLGFKISLHHGQLIEIRQQCQIHCTHSNYLFFII